MSSVNLNPSSYVSDVFSSKPLRGSFKENAEAFGPVAASAIGVAQAAAGVAGSTVTLSTRAMEELADAAGDGLQTLEQAAGSAYDGVKEFAHDAADCVGHAATALYDSIGSGLGTAAGYAAAGTQAVSELL